ncbi:MAG: ABC transporter ATP-binding protein [Halobacteriales archaeon]
MSEAVLRAEAITHRFDGATALESVDLSVAPGSLVAVVGPNGSGKTTLLRVLVGLLRPSDGRVARPHVRRGRPVGYLPQHPRFRPGFTARETLAFYARLVDAPEGAPDRLLGRVGLAEAADRRVEALSGGMRGLLGVAQALVGDPPVVVLDEPTTGLDPGMRRRIFGVLDELVDDGRGVLVASHDLDRVDRGADRVVVLDAGRVVTEGTPSGLRERFEVDSLEAVYEAAVESPTGAIRVRRGRS